MTSRSAFLVNEAEKEYKTLLEMVEKLGVNDLSADTYVKNGHDILMSYVRAKMLNHLSRSLKRSARLPVHISELA